MRDSAQYFQDILTWVGVMSDVKVMAGLAIVVLLLSYLYIKWHKRIFREPGAEPTEPDLREWRGKPIEVSQLKPTLERVRQDYIAGRESARGILFHRNLLRLSRQAVARLPFFQGREPEGQLPGHPGS